MTGLDTPVLELEVSSYLSGEDREDNPVPRGRFGNTSTQI